MLRKLETKLPAIILYCCKKKRHILVRNSWINKSCITNWFKLIYWKRIVKQQYITKIGIKLKRWTYACGRKVMNCSNSINKHVLRLLSALFSNLSSSPFSNPFQLAAFLYRIVILSSAVLFTLCWAQGEFNAIMAFV